MNEKQIKTIGRIIKDLYLLYTSADRYKDSANSNTDILLKCCIKNLESILAYNGYKYSFFKEDVEKI